MGFISPQSPPLKSSNSPLLMNTDEVGGGHYGIMAVVTRSYTYYRSSFRHQKQVVVDLGESCFDLGTRGFEAWGKYSTGPRLSIAAGHH